MKPTKSFPKQLRARGIQMTLKGIVKTPAQAKGKANLETKQGLIVFVDPAITEPGPYAIYSGRNK